MSKHETPLIHTYWKQIGGTLIEEFPAVKPSATNGRRLLDAIIIPDGERRIAAADDVSLKGKDIICVQAKASRLGMYLMGQVFFSAQLLQVFEPHSVTSVALCTQDDSVLRPLLEQYPGMQVVVIELSEDG